MEIQETRGTPPALRLRTWTYRGGVKNLACMLLRSKLQRYLSNSIQRRRRKCNKYRTNQSPKWNRSITHYPSKDDYSLRLRTSRRRSHTMGRLIPGRQETVEQLHFRGKEHDHLFILRFATLCNAVAPRLLKERVTVAGRDLRALRAHHDYHTCGPRRVAGRRLRTILHTNAFTPDTVGHRDTGVIIIRSTRAHTRLAQVGTTTVNGANSPVCNTPAVLIILTSTGTHYNIRSNDLIVNGLVGTTTTVKLNDY